MPGPFEEGQEEAVVIVNIVTPGGAHEERQIRVPIGPDTTSDEFTEIVESVIESWEPASGEPGEAIEWYIQYVV